MFLGINIRIEKHEFTQFGSKLRRGIFSLIDNSFQQLQLIIDKLYQGKLCENKFYSVPKI